MILVKIFFFLFSLNKNGIKLENNALLILTKTYRKTKRKIVKTLNLLWILIFCQKNIFVLNLQLWEIWKNLGELKFKELLNKSKSLKGQSKTHKNITTDFPETNIDNQDLKNYNDPKILDESKTASVFAPRIIFWNCPHRLWDIIHLKRISSVPISEVDFSRVVYMLVDKKIELEIKVLKDFQR